MNRASRAPSQSSTEGSSQARRALGHALAFANERNHDAARRAIRSALASAGDDAQILVVAGLLLFVVGDYHASLELLRRADARGAGAAVYWLVQERAQRLGWDIDARDALHAGARAEPDDPLWYAALLSQYAKRRSYTRALEVGRRALELAPDSPTLRMELAGIYAERGDTHAMSEQVERALEQAGSPPFRLEAGRLMRRIGDFERAQAYLETVLDDETGRETALLALAELALWTKDHALAAKHAHARLALGPSVAAERILGAIAFLEGRTSEAQACFARALSIEPRDSETHAWLAHVAIAERRLDDAHTHVSTCVGSGSGEVFAASLLRLRVNVDESPDYEFPPHHIAEHLRPSLREMCPELEHVLRGHDRDAWRALLDLALARMHGNRSTTATYLDGAGALRRVPSLRDPRLESRLVLNRIRTDDPEPLLTEFDALTHAFPWSGLPLAHKGELLLWLGRYDEAEAALHGAIDIVVGTRWAYIGLSVIDIVRRDYERALRTLAKGIEVMGNTTGPAVFVHRGEALLRLGRLDEAEKDLERAVEANATRLATYVLLARLHLERGDMTRAWRSFDEVRRRAPGYCADAAREVGVELPRGPDRAGSSEALRSVLEHAIHMLRGNRSSSCVSYVTREGRLRFEGRGVPNPHRRDTIDIALASMLLERGIDPLPRPGRAQRARDTESAAR